MNRYKAGQLFCIICIAVFMLFQFKQPSDSKKNFEDVVQKTIEKIDVSQFEQQDNLAMKRFLSLNPEEYENIIYYKDIDALKSREFVIVKFKNSKQASYFKLNIENRIENQINVFDGYAQDQADLLKEAVIDIQSNYALYVVLENAKEVDNAFLLAL
ncbi:MAG: DUF4358 domain-containing protein [Floccifex porci]|uniref:DUF4358 domain-containing protein n=1 Tax=Floccifex porci TaxID=2606629 RepID=A0A7X2T418_9FIRM|nr:DUF4358 domain-containing protein [Floccifex porci]MCI7802830.1 DUF4358 domain-containing protein [Erysipelotrichaceae bacterium]MDD7466888.1 DUF4358 domain-containing protein [Floccifex porci]MDO4480086.1 DUF4358 domain-containing protein [Erysipelotrichaceae bacterium]MDY4796355.1 DUF4358 domain-containing protein [Floccifex porci]MSS01311.1 DUF4358 domain-containing protein [Floccifex porci]